MQKKWFILLAAFVAAASGAAAERAQKNSARMLATSIQRQLAGRAGVPTYVSMAPEQKPEASEQPRPEGGPAVDPNRHHLSVLSGYYIGVKKHELTRSECALKGVSMGLGLGMMIGAIGTTTGLFGDEDSYYLIGAMSILGAIMGSQMGYQSNSFSTEWRWEDAKRQLDWRDEMRHKYQWEK